MNIAGANRKKNSHKDFKVKAPITMNKTLKI